MISFSSFLFDYMYGGWQNQSQVPVMLLNRH
jgi:hypothetical protein